MLSHEEKVAQARHARASLTHEQLVANGQKTVAKLARTPEDMRAMSRIYWDRVKAAKAAANGEVAK